MTSTTTVVDTKADKKAKETARLLKAYDDFFALMNELGYKYIDGRADYDETDYHKLTRSNIELRIKKGYSFAFKDPASELHVRLEVSAPDRSDWYNDTHKLSVSVRPDSYQWTDKAYPRKPYAKPETLRKTIQKVIADTTQADRELASQDRFFDLNIDRAVDDINTLFNYEAKLNQSKGCCDIVISYKFHKIRVELGNLVENGIDKMTILEKVGHYDSRHYVITLAQWKQHVDLLASFNAANLKEEV